MIIEPPRLAWPKPIHPDENRRQRPNCPDCGSPLLLAEKSRFNLAGRIDYLPACDDCGAEFETSIQVAR